MYNTCSYPSGSGGVRACQTDDEKELVHSRYPCELEGTRVGRVEGGRTRARMKRAKGRRIRERERESARANETERAGEQGAGLRLRCVLVWPKGVEGRISGWATPWEDEGWPSGGWWDSGSAGKGVDSLEAARLPKQ